MRPLAYRANRTLRLRSAGDPTCNCRGLRSPASDQQPETRALLSLDPDERWRD